MNFCSHCGAKVVSQDNEPHTHCNACNTTHYRNPVVLVSCYALWENKALWIKRATEPCAGLWAVPSGYLEEGETPQQAAAREVREETGADVSIEAMELHTVGTIVDINQVYLVFRAPLLAPRFHNTAEASDVQLFAADEVPYDQFAYPEVLGNVQAFYDELAAGRFKVHLGVLKDGENTVRAVSHAYP